MRNAPEHKMVTGPLDGPQAAIKPTDPGGFAYVPPKDEEAEKEEEKRG